MGQHYLIQNLPWGQMNKGVVHNFIPSGIVLDLEFLQFLGPSYGVRECPGR